MPAEKGKPRAPASTSKSHTGTPLRHERVVNSKGHNSLAATLGRDTVPGAFQGAPLAQNKATDDGTVKRTRYNGVYPGSMNGGVKR